MTVVCISDLAGCPGDEVASSAAEALGVRLLSEEAVRLAAKSIDVPVDKFHKCLEEPVGLFGPSLHARRRAACALRCVIVEAMVEGSLVYRVPLGHHLVRGIPHLVKVRLGAPFEHRVAEFSRLSGKAPEAARKQIARMDDARRQLARLLFDADDEDSNMFDLVLNAANMPAAEIVEVVASAARQNRYRKTHYSEQLVRDLMLACRVQLALIGMDPAVDVTSDRGAVKIRTRLPARAVEKLKARASAIDGVTEVECEVVGGPLSPGSWRLR